MKYLVVASKLDPAGVNITTQLSQFSPFIGEHEIRFYLIDEDILHEENLSIDKINKHDFIIFASKHESSKSKKTLSIHSAGNLREADMGGKPGKLSMCSAQFMKQGFETLNRIAKESLLDKHYNITLEATHHGPLINKPCLFIEIGSTENEWKDKRAGFVIAKTIIEAIETFKPLAHREIAVAIGGPHYCPNFNKIQLKSNVAISHVIPQYVFPLTGEMVTEAIQKTYEDVDFVLLDFKGLGNEESRKEIVSILGDNHINYEKVSDILKR